ncbi:MAG: response regulator [Veillonellaceae bacterium]|nr:response regulator [Veillonellaceae bacterium]
MRKIRVLVIDDSPFSQAVIQKTLPEANFEICGLAANGQQGIGKYSVLKPDVVIMDITMPDMDGLECSRQILLRDPAACIVLLSSMKDDALTARARLLGIRWFLQKPATRDDLVGMIKLAISRVAPEWWVPYQEQLRLSFEEFVSKSLEPQTCTFTRIENPPDSLDSQGICAIIGITGSHTGRVILDTSHETAAAFAEVLLGHPASPDEALGGLGEMANVVCGRGISQANRISKGMDLRITPASLLEGKKLIISNLPNHHVLAVSAQTPIGSFLISMEMTEE